VKALTGVKKIALVIAVLGVLFMVFFWGVLPFFLDPLKSSYGGFFERLLIGSVILWMGVMGTYILLHVNSLKQK